MRAILAPIVRPHRRVLVVWGALACWPRPLGWRSRSLRAR